MEGPLTDDQLTQLAQVAKAKGHTTDELAQEVLARYSSKRLVLSKQ